MVTFIRIDDSGFIGDRVAAINLLSFGAFSVTAARTHGSLGVESILKLWHWQTGNGVILVGESSDIASGIPALISRSSDVSLASKVNNIVTAVRDREGNLVLASWQTELLEQDLRRMSDSGNQGGPAEFVNIRSVSSPNTTADFVTSIKDASGNLRLIAWKIDDVTGRLTRLGDSKGQGDPVDLVDATVLDNIVISAIRTTSGNLKIISWLISPDGSHIDPVAHSGEQEKGISEITIAGSISSEKTMHGAVVTAVRDGAENLKLIHWLIAPGGTTIERGDDIVEDRQHTISITQYNSSRYVTVSEGHFGGLRLFAFDIDDAGKFHRTGELMNDNRHGPNGHHSIVTNNAATGDLTTVFHHQRSSKQMVVAWKLEE
ncbi:hypothetical protein ACX80V_21700 [Arthrobacter sp. MDT3-24]